MASVSSKTDEIVDEKLEEKNEVDDRNTETQSAIISEEKPVSEDVSIVEELEKSGKIKEVETPENIDADSIYPKIEVDVKDLEVETGIPEEQKKESSDAVVPDVSKATQNDDLDAPTSIEVPLRGLEVQSAFPEEQKQEKITETQEPISYGATINNGREVVKSSSHEEKGSRDAEAVQKEEESSEEITENLVETREAKTEVAQNSTDIGAAEFSCDEVRAPETIEMVKKEKNVSSNIEKEGIEATVKDGNIVPEASEVPFKDKEVSASDEKKSESFKDVYAASVKAPKDFTTVEESPEQVIEENKNESSKITAEAVKDIGPSEMVEEKKNESKDHSMVEKNVQIPDDKKELQLEETIQIAIDKSEKKELGAEKEDSQKSKDVDPILPSDTADTKLIKKSTKSESGNFFSKAKRSIVKAKKAILGKSAGPKTVSSEIKDGSS
ncbi:uncharacterized protein LOC110019967 [Phalaenopsis equestris]|uniref:uncharacterized protein LOC110019967 n=1 Tax=Phalaenopsis equestris TaxID=78828 RepID=UPI0009E23FDE|nr:uncharacterized protein LOC110019967 [Phalaenopsis equestris]